VSSHYYRLGYLSRFQSPICPGFGIGIRPPGQKPLEAFVPVHWAICPGSKDLFVPVLESGFGRRDKSPWKLLSRFIGPFVPVPKAYLSRFWVVEPGQKVPHAKKSLRPAGFEPKTYCLAHDFLTNSPK